jgi:hypothetical protein
VIKNNLCVPSHSKGISLFFRQKHMYCLVL